MVWDGITLEEYVERLLRDGKRSQHPDFEILFNIFGKDRIVKIAKDILNQWKADKDRDTPS